MVWSGFRPSDDACIYGYLIPSNMFAVVAMHYLTSILQRVYHDKPTADNAWNLSVQIRNGIEKYGKTNYAGFDSIYAYEVDGLGHTNMMDDANVPSLLSIPYFGYQSVADGRYQRTRSFVLSSHDPYYFTGKYATGVGSPHTPRGWVWPLALVVQALTSGARRTRSKCSVTSPTPSKAISYSTSRSIPTIRRSSRAPTSPGPTLSTSN